MRRKQVIEILTTWQKNMTLKIRTLTLASRIYQVLGYIIKILMATISVGLIYIEGHIVAESFHGLDNQNLIIGLSITAVCLQVLLASFNVMDGVINPSEKCKQCSICQKNYQELVRELSVIILDLEASDFVDTLGSEEEEGSDYNPDIAAKYNNLALNYSTKEQLILNYEPLISFGRRQCITNEI